MMNPCVYMHVDMDINLRMINILVGYFFLTFSIHAELAWGLAMRKHPEINFTQEETIPMNEI